MRYFDRNLYKTVISIDENKKRKVITYLEVSLKRV